MDNFDLRKYLAEGKLYENVLAQKLRDEAKHPDSKVGAAILNKYAEKVEKANKEDYVKLLKDMESELISKHPDTFSGEDDIPGSFLFEDKLNEQLDLSSREYPAKKLFALIARDLKFSSRVQDNEMLNADEALEIMRKVIEIEGTESSPEAALGEYIANGEL